MSPRPQTPLISQAAHRCVLAWEALTTRPLALYGSAVLRIGYSLAFLLFLLREFPEREQLWGPNAAWTPAMAHQYAQSQNWFGWVKSWYTLLATTSDVRFELSYDLALLICLATALGYRTRLSSVLFMLVVTTFTARDTFLGDGGDNVMTLMSLYLVFLASGRRLSLDARRRARRAAPPHPSPSAARRASGARAEWGELRRRTVTLTHNAAVLVVGFQMCVIYGAAGLWKAQGPLWQNGTAMYYVLHVDWFRPWPGLSDLVAGNSIGLCVIAYVTVFAQIGFPFALFTKRLKYIILALLLLMHIGIAVLLGIPVFSLVMVVGDSVFLPDAFWLAVGRRVRRRRVRTAALAPETEALSEPVLQG
jgi:Vitamin K-dependent gamma-carboxylase